MTTNVQTITPARLSDAPRIMARYNIRHLPVVAEEKGRKRLIGVLSMRDVFRYVMEELDFDLSKIYRPGTEVPKARKKVIGVFSADPAVGDLVDRSAKLSRHLLVRTSPLHEGLENLSELLDRFDALFLDLDELKPVELAKVLAVARSAGKENLLFFLFSPSRLPGPGLEELRRVSVRKRIRLLSKPISLGLLYEQFLRLKARLESEGLVVNEPNRGMMVTRLDASMVSELYVMREVLESTAAALAARHATDVEISLLRDNV